MHPITAALSWLGERAGWSLAVGMLASLLLPSVPESVLAVALPITSASLLAVAFARLDIASVTASWRDAAARRVSAVCVAGLLPLSIGAVTAASVLLDLDPTLALCLAIFAAAPPIGSSAALCFMLGLDAAVALQLTVAITLLTPLIGPLCLIWIAGIELPVAPLALTLSLTAIIAGAVVSGLGFRRAVGKRWIGHHPRALDGIAALAMLCFLLPLFASVKPVLLENLALAAELMALVFVISLGTNLAVRALAARWTHHARAGAYGILSGNRNIALYYASMPPDPVVGLFVALYQVPMFLTPLLLKGRAAKTRPDG